MGSEDICTKLLELSSSLSRTAEQAEKWTREYINSLPNAAFAVIESGYKEGENKNARHLPHHTSSVKSASENSTVDISHYRNALARANQVVSVLKNNSDSELRKKAVSHLEKHRSVLKDSKADLSELEAVVFEECEQLFEALLKSLSVSFDANSVSLDLDILA